MNADGVGSHFMSFFERPTVSNQTRQQGDSYLIAALRRVFRPSPRMRLAIASR